MIYLKIWLIVALLLFIFSLISDWSRYGDMPEDEDLFELVWLSLIWPTALLFGVFKLYEMYQRRKVK